MHVVKSNAQHNFVMNNDGFNQQLNKSSLERDVGVLISNDMKCDEQVRATTAKANSMPEML
jgi:hypothetical protein